ncbi:MAG: hypothetical protein ICCCNLDF_03698 [Planctomycetes bacterium]|nr:hypothetical protein [Planctomycetota bacterium]
MIIADAEIVEKIANLLGVPVADLERLIWRVHKCQVPGYIDEPHITLSEAARRTGLGVKLLRKAIRCGEVANSPHDPALASSYDPTPAPRRTFRTAPRRRSRSSCSCSMRCCRAGVSLVG